ncbi:MAG: hypothetical protein ACPGVP_19475 [Thiolinea sp.]
MTAATEKGLLVRYRVKGDFEIWKSWQHLDSNHLRATSRPTAKPSRNDMPLMLRAWQESGRVDPNHGYIATKLIVPIGIKQTKKRHVIREKTTSEPEHYLSANTLLIPAHCNTTGAIKAFTTISNTGRKFARGSISNCHLWIGGNAGTGDGNLYISESYSSGVSVHMRTRAPVVIAFSTSGLMGTGQMLRAKYPEAQIVFAADNDAGVTFRADSQERENPGIYYATKAAEAIGGTLILPLGDGKRDFNDWHIEQCPK